MADMEIELQKVNFLLKTLKYKLAKNNGENHLHGGTIGFDAVIWKARQTASNQIEFTRVSPRYGGRLSGQPGCKGYLYSFR